MAQQESEVSLREALSSNRPRSRAYAATDGPIRAQRRPAMERPPWQRGGRFAVQGVIQATLKYAHEYTLSSCALPCSCV